MFLAELHRSRIERAVGLAVLFTSAFVCASASAACSGQGKPPVRFVPPAVKARQQAAAPAAPPAVAPAAKRTIRPIPSSSTNMAHSFRAAVRDRQWKPASRTDKPAWDVVNHQSRTYLRVHDLQHKGGQCAPPSCWLIARSSIPSGLTDTKLVEHLRDRFAIPPDHALTHISEITLPPGAKTRISFAQGHEGWGRGGGLQHEIKTIPRGTVIGIKSRKLD